MTPRLSVSSSSSDDIVLSMTDLEKRRCKAIDKRYTFCEPDITSPPQINTTSDTYNIFYANLRKHCHPYTGKKVFIGMQNGNTKYICPKFKIYLKKWYSFSVASNGYIYLHLLKDLLSNSQNCVYLGNHITIAPTKKTHIHFHITSLDFTIQDNKITSVRNKSASFCSLDMRKLKHIIEKAKSDDEILHLVKNEICVNENLDSYMLNVQDTLWNDVRYDEIDDIVQLLVALFKKGFVESSK